MGKDDPEFPRLDTVVTWTLEATAAGGTLLHEGLQPTDYAFQVIGGWRSMLTQEKMSGVLAGSLV